MGGHRETVFLALRTYLGLGQFLVIFLRFVLWISNLAVSIGSP